MATLWLTAVLLAAALGVEGQQPDVLYAQIHNLLTHRFSKQPSVPAKPVEVPGWGRSLDGRIGQVSGVSVNSRGQPVIFHRGPKIWDYSSFNGSEHFAHADEGPIAVDTVLTLDPETAAVVSAWGRSMFYMPHGLTVDLWDNVWLTDVALHQVFKFGPEEHVPQLIVGERFVPGGGRRRLCKPTAVAVASNGDFFVADGYCNQRVLKFNARGHLLRILPQPPEFLSLQVPHGLALLESEDLLCIADRENMRVACPRAGLRGPQWGGGPPYTVQQPDLGRVFAVAATGDVVYAVNGPTSPQIPIQGFTLKPKEEAIVDHWAPAKGFKNPHALAVCRNGSALYVAEIGPNRVWKFLLKRAHQ